MGWTHGIRAWWHLRVGRARLALGDREGARAALQAALPVVRPGLRQAVLNGLGVLSYDLGDLEGARARYEEALRLAPDDAGLLMNLGNALDSMGDSPGAVAAYRRALAAGGPQPDVLFNLAVALARTEPREAVDLMRQCLELRVPRADLDGEDVPVELAAARLAELSLELGLVDESDAFLRALEGSAPPDAPGRTLSLTPAGLTASAPTRRIIANERAMMLSRAGRHEEALSAYAALLALDPSAQEVRFNVGMALLRAGRLDEAAGRFREVHVPESWFGLGQVEEQAGRMAEAAEHYRRFLAEVDAAPGGRTKGASALDADWREHARAFVDGGTPG